MLPAKLPMRTVEWYPRNRARRSSRSSRPRSLGSKSEPARTARVRTGCSGSAAVDRSFSARSSAACEIDGHHRAGVEPQVGVRIDDVKPVPDGSTAMSRREEDTICRAARCRSDQYRSRTTPGRAREEAERTALRGFVSQRLHDLRTAWAAARRAMGGGTASMTRSRAQARGRTDRRRIATVLAADAELELRAWCCAPSRRRSRISAPTPSRSMLTNGSTVKMSSRCSRPGTCRTSSRLKPKVGLGQVVGAEAEELRVLGDLVGGQRGARASRSSCRPGTSPSGPSPSKTSSATGRTIAVWSFSSFMG